MRDNIPDNFKMYLTIHETTKMLNNEQHGMLMKAVQGVQFYEVHIDEIVFEDMMVQMAWVSAKIQIRKQIDGFCSKKKLRYSDMFKGGYQGGYQDPTQQSQSQSQPKPKPKPKPKTESQICSSVTEVSATLLSANRISAYLLEKILSNKLNFKQPNLSAWAKDIDLAIRIDKRSEEQLIGCINWIYSAEGSFWIPNILSAKKLRQKFDTMESQMTNKKQKSQTIVDKLYDNGMTAQDLIKEMEMRA